MSNVYWASILACLGWLYAFWANRWPDLFQRQDIAEGAQEQYGYRVGEVLHWRLPGRAAALMSLVVLLFIFAIFLPESLSRWIILAGSVLIPLLWLSVPPGMKLAHELLEKEDGEVERKLRTSRSAGRSLAVFLIFGLLPALAVGSLLDWIINRLIG